MLLMVVVTVVVVIMTVMMVTMVVVVTSVMVLLLMIRTVWCPENLNLLSHELSLMLKSEPAWRWLKRPGTQRERSWGHAVTAPDATGSRPFQW